MGRIEEVGCIHLDHTRAVYEELKMERQVRRGKGDDLDILVFTSDIDLATSVYSGSFFTLDYNLRFLDACLELAQRFRSCSFRFKVKDVRHIDLLLSIEEFRNKYERNGSNCEFVELGRCEYSDEMAKADIVLAIGFTSPGMEAFFLGKKAIYYSELQEFGEAFKLVPDFVAESREEFMMLFKNAVAGNAVNGVGRKGENGGSPLDPFCDGYARRRMLNYLKLEVGDN